jgi:predicted transcriptional regulator
MDVLYRRGSATARAVASDLGGARTYSTVRTQLGVLARKGFVRHETVGRVYVYRPVISRKRAQRAELQRVIDTYFEGSAADVMALLSSQTCPLRRRKADVRPLRSSKEKSASVDTSKPAFVDSAKPAISACRPEAVLRLGAHKLV